MNIKKEIVREIAIELAYATQLSPQYFDKFVEQKFNEYEQDKAYQVWDGLR